jgi:hypothetical protein
MNDPKAPERVQLPCLACRRKTWHEVVAETVTGEDDHESGWFTSEKFQVVRCCGCEIHSYRTTYEDASWGPDDVPNEALWPPRTRKRAALKRSHQLPPPLLRVYRETNTALSSEQPILAAVGIRALVEAICKQKRARGKTLKARIDDLAVRGVLTNAQTRVLHKTRFLGNKAAHEASPADEKVLEAAMQIAEHMLTAVYLLPKLARVMRRK